MASDQQNKTARSRSAGKTTSKEPPPLQSATRSSAPNAPPILANANYIVVDRTVNLAVPSFDPESDLFGDRAAHYDVQRHCWRQGEAKARIGDRERTRAE